MQVVICKIVAVDEFFDCSWISTITRKDVNIWWKCSDLLVSYLKLVAFFVKYFNSGKPQIIHVTPSLSDDKLQLLALRQSRYELKLRLNLRLLHNLNLKFLCLKFWCRLNCHRLFLLYLRLFAEKLVKNIWLRLDGTRFANFVRKRAFNPRCFSR